MKLPWGSLVRQEAPLRELPASEVRGTGAAWPPASRPRIPRRRAHCRHCKPLAPWRRISGKIIDGQPLQACFGTMFQTTWLCFKTIFNVVLAPPLPGGSRGRVRTVIFPRKWGVFGPTPGRIQRGWGYICTSLILAPNRMVGGEHGPSIGLNHALIAF